MRRVVFPPNYAAWRLVALDALRRNEAPPDITFIDEAAQQGSLFGRKEPSTRGGEQEGLAKSASPPHVPRAFVEAARLAAAHREPKRWDDLYRLLWRLTHGEPHLMDVASDADVLAVVRRQRQVVRDIHKCHAFVRFRAVAEAGAPDGRHFVAWYEPDHFVLELSVPHFQARFGNMHWTILTPDRSVSWAHQRLTFHAGATRAEAPDNDALEELWKTYYANIFNPARLNVRAQRQEMPQRFWRNAPEAELNRELTAHAAARAESFMQAQPKRAEPAPTYRDLAAVTADLKGCSVCEWAGQSTQAVGGEGPSDAPLVLVGEQPGDVEDRTGRPFVGPAGQLLDRALVAAGIERKTVYVTNAVKHFKFEPRGKRRLHAKPNATDVAACRGWLAAELAQVQPQVLVCLGLTAALSVFGKQVRLHAVRGSWHETRACPHTLVTSHPSAILRMPEEAQAAGFSALVDDLKLAAEALVKEPS